MTDPSKMRYVIGAAISSEEPILTEDSEPFFDSEDELIAFLKAVHNASDHDDASYVRDTLSDQTPARKKLKSVPTKP